MTGFDELAPGERFPVSATLFTTYQQCPMQALARLRGMYPPTTRASFKGSLAHRIFAYHLEEGTIDESGFSDLCRREAGSNLGAAMASLRLKPSQFRRIVVEVADLYDRFKAIPVNGFVAAEVSVEAEPVEGLHLRGRVDAVFSDGDGVRIVDWKTGTNLDGAVPQLEFYAMAWEEAFGVRPCALEALSIRTGERIDTAPTAEDVDRVRRDVSLMVSDLRPAMARDCELDRTAGPFCRWCPLLGDCTEGAAAVEILG